MINYFNFKKVNKQFLLTNDFGRYIFLEANEFNDLLKTSHVSNEEAERRLLKNGFIYNSDDFSFSEQFSHHYVNAKNYLHTPTQLHIFVITNSCNLDCIYCQAHSENTKKVGFMTKDVARKAVDFALESPAYELDFEFQGGEPLMNFEILKFIVQYTEAKKNNKHINYSIASNLTILSDEMIDFIIDHNISVSTSIDGNEFLHNKNRPYKNGAKSFDKVKSSLRTLTEKGVSVGALLTTTRSSLTFYKEIIDTYIELGLNTISIRPLTPLGCAKEHWKEIGYTSEEFTQFYKKCFNYILKLNLSGVFLKEGLASVFLKKILEGIALNYMELRSPCGATLGQIAYYFDGNIYTCDEGRMLAEMGDSSFLLGNLEYSTYENVVSTNICRSVCRASILETLPSCSQCVYQPYCGVCPIVNYALYDDVYENKPNNYRCLINKGMLDVIFEKLQEDDYQIRQIFRSWIN